MKKGTVGSLCLLAFLATPAPRSAAHASDTPILAKARKIHEQVITLDTHVDIAGSQYATPRLDPGIENPRLKCDLVKMKKGGVDGVFLAVYVGQRAALDDAGYKVAQDSALAKFEAIHRLLKTMHPDKCSLATSPEQVERIARTGKRVVMIGIENGYPVGTDLSMLGKYYDLGARYITLSHSGHNQICDSSGPPQPMHGGLSQFGKQVVAGMNRLGMMIDVSHISEKSFWDVLEITRAPIIASHSGCAALNPHDRNLTDAQLRALAGNDGVIQIVALGSFLKADSPERRKAITELLQELGFQRQRRQEMTDDQIADFEKLQSAFQERMKAIDEKYPTADLKTFVDHIDHAVKIAGIDHVGIGTDFDGGGGIRGFTDHSEALNVTVELVRRGYSKKEIQKIWGGNLLRVWRAVEKAARSGR
jgi:microsomal dipeptidase-like Zn-dependent dipeptidase